MAASLASRAVNERKEGGVNKRGERVAIAGGVEGVLLSSALKRPMNGGER